MSTPPGWLFAGAVGSPHGLDGSFHVVDPKPELLGPADTLRVGGDADVDGALELRIVRRAGTERRPILRLEGCEDRAAAKALNGRELLVSRSSVPELGPDEWWATDLEGCTVRAASTSPTPVVGTVRRLLSLPSCDVLEVARADGGPDLLVPLIRDAVPRVDVERKEIEVDLEFLGES
jgi:16S rRNA processing protein RimM